MKNPSLNSFLVGMMFLSLSPFALGAESLQAELKVVPHVDLRRYLGAWYSIASIPQVFDRKCVG
jgi:apolipoprotein D and lipocalin family protein